MPARDPARFGQAKFGYARFSVYQDEYQKMFNQLQRSITRRVANWNVDRDTTTGWREPEYDEQTINGILVEQSSDLPAFAAGVVMTGDAVLFTLDGVDVMDQIKDDPPLKYWEVISIEEYTHPKQGGFAYRVCHLHRLILYKEG